MLSHSAIWAAIDALAARHQLTASGLARLGGLDATAFNPSKRISRDGRQRWPSTESIAKLLEATGETAEGFLAGGQAYTQTASTYGTTFPLLGLAKAGAGGFFDSGGLPTGEGWDEVRFPHSGDGSTYALEVTGDSMLPAYRHGDILIVSPSDQLRRGDRVVVRTRDGEVMAKILYRQTARSLELHSLNPEHPPRTLNVADVEWMARILWASQ